MKLILHLGAHKTGTTSIQSFLDAKSLELSRNGWEFITLENSPNLGRCVSFSRDARGVHFNLEEGSYSELVERLKSTDKNKIVSSEDMFFLNDNEGIKRFCQKVKSIFSEIDVIVYLRNQVDMALSNKAQGAKTNQSAMLFGNDYTNPLPEINDDVYEYLDYYSKLKMWNHYLPKSSFIIRHYDRRNLKNGDSVHDFIHSTKLPLEPDILVDNSSLGSITTNVLHALRFYGVEAMKVWELYDAGYFKDLGGIKQQPSKTEADIFYAKFEESNQKLAEEYGLDFNLDTSNYPDDRVVQEIFLKDMLTVVMPAIMEIINPATISIIVDLLRDSSVLLEDVDIQKSYQLMQLAGLLRPDGSFINRKSLHLESRLINSYKN